MAALLLAFVGFLVFAVVNVVIQLLGGHAVFRLPFVWPWLLAVAVVVAGLGGGDVMREGISAIRVWFTLGWISIFYFTATAGGWVVCLTGPAALMFFVLNGRARRRRKGHPA